MFETSLIKFDPSELERVECEAIKLELWINIHFLIMCFAQSRFVL